MFKKKEENVKHKISKWYNIDISLCGIIIFLGMPLSMILISYSSIWGMAIILYFVVRLGKNFYYIDKPVSKSFKIITTIVRSMLYAMVIFVTIIPLTISKDWKWYYPVQRMAYLSNYNKGSSMYEFLPEKIPSNAKEYEIRFVQKLMQGSAAIDICFYTDSKTIVEYRKKAVDYGAEKVDIMSENLRYKGLLEAYNAPVDNTEIYIFWNGYENTAMYMLNEHEGYFRLYY